jgi:leader peptidase (prepilin peptidase)/N-methyltransferase
MIGSFIIVGGVWVWLAKCLKSQLNFNIQPKYWLFCMPVFFGMLSIDQPLLIIKTGAFLGMMVFITIYDYQTKTIPQFVHVILLIIGCIDINSSWVIAQALPGLLLLPIPIAGVYGYQKLKEPSKNIGIGDIKLIAVCGWVIGINMGLIGLCVGLELFLGWCVIKKVNQETAIPFGPFLCMGFTLGYGLIL